MDGTIDLDLKLEQMPLGDLQTHQHRAIATGGKARIEPAANGIQIYVF